MDISTALVLIGGALQVIAVFYVTAEVWQPPVSRSVSSAWSSVKQRARLVAARVWFLIRRLLRIRRDLSISVPPATATASGSVSLSVNRGAFPWEAKLDEQMQYVGQRLEMLVADADARRAQIEQLEADLRAEIESRIVAVSEHVQGRFEISARKAFLSGLLAIVGTILITIGDLSA